MEQSRDVLRRQRMKHGNTVRVKTRFTLAIRLQQAPPRRDTADNALGGITRQLVTALREAIHSAINNK